MRLIVAGVGPGDPGLVTLRAIEAIEKADIVLIPHSKTGRPSVAAQTVERFLKGKTVLSLVFPMTEDTALRDESLRKQLLELRPEWDGVSNAVLPVIGDSALYATGAYLFDVWSELVPGLELVLVPGVSAHSLSASCAAAFLALAQDILTIIPGTAPLDRIEKALQSADSVALYKPSALAGELRGVVERTGKWRKIIRVDRAGLPDERIIEGDAALDAPDEYLSTLLLWAARSQAPERKK